MPYPHTTELIEQYATRLGNGNLTNNELVALNEAFSNTEPYDPFAEINENNHSKSDAFNDFVLVIGSILPKDTLHRLTARLLSAAKEGVERNEFLRNASLAKSFLAFEMATFPGKAEDHFDRMLENKEFTGAEISTLKNIILNPVIAIFNKNLEVPVSHEIKETTKNKDSENYYLFNLIGENLINPNPIYQTIINESAAKLIGGKSTVEEFLNNISIIPSSTSPKINLRAANQRLSIRYHVAWDSLEKASKKLTNTALQSNITQLLDHVGDLSIRKKEPLSDLTQVLENTNALLNDKMPVDTYKKQAKTMEGSPSTGLKVLGRIMMAIGVLAVIAGVAMAFTAAGAAPGAGLAASGAALVTIGAAFFAAVNIKTGLSKNISEVAKAKDPEYFQMI